MMDDRLERLDIIMRCSKESVVQLFCSRAKRRSESQERFDILYSLVCQQQLPGEKLSNRWR
jgi:hypothetical protein